MYYYNQTQYSNIPYDNKSTINKIETISSSGCGVCCACMIVNNLAKRELYPVSQMAEFSIKNGARDNSGTNLRRLLSAICGANKDFSYELTNDESKLVNHLKSGGMAIANQGDKYNVFSSQGHFVVCSKMIGDNIEILDPYMYKDKYSLEPRASRIISKTSNGCVVSTSQISLATQDRKGGGYVAYYLVKYNKPYPLPRYNAGSNYKLTAYINVWDYPSTTKGKIKRVRDLTVNGKMHCSSKNLNANATLVTGTIVTCQGVSKDDKGNIWLKIPSGYIPVYYNGKKRANWYNK